MRPSPGGLGMKDSRLGRSYRRKNGRRI
jgi:hypothetical protein